MASPRQAFYGNDLSQASEQLAKLSAKPKGDDTVVELDLALVDLFAGDPSAAERRLRSVRDRWDHLEQKSLAEQAASMLTDDGSRKYSGEDYEKLLVRVFLTLSSLMQDGVDAESYSLQTLDKTAELQAAVMEKQNSRRGESKAAVMLKAQGDLPPVNLSKLGPHSEAAYSASTYSDPPYSAPAIAPYLRGVLREATLSNYDDAAWSYEQALALQPDSDFILRDLERASTGVHSAPGNGVVYLIALVGRGPYKIEVEEPATQGALLLADQIVSSIGEYRVPPTLAPIKVPRVVSPPKPFELLGVAVNGRRFSTTMPISDLQILAEETFAAKLPEIMARTIARRVIKKGAIYAAKDQFQANSSLASLAFDAAGVLWEATESADTRCWGLLPREIQILRLELPAGRHALQLEPVSRGTAIAAGVSCYVDVVDGRNTYVLSYWPDTQPVGQILVSP